MANIFKIVLLGVLGFGLLVYLTAPKQLNKQDKVTLNKELNTSLFILKLLEYQDMQKNQIYLKKI